MAQSGLRANITAAYRRSEPECLAPLLDAAALTPDGEAAISRHARILVQGLRQHQTHCGLVDGLIHEFSLSSHEGVALMCLAEALLRIPDDQTRDELIRDKLKDGDWHSHLGHSPSLAVNAATWGLVVTGKLVGTSHGIGIKAAITRLIAKGGEPLIRQGVDLMMRLMGEHFVAGQTIEAALDRARQGYRHSYDMLGEAALTAQDADGYFSAYERAIHAIGTAAAGQGIIQGPGISVKLSALHPRFCRAQRDRVMGEALPRLVLLALLARTYDLGLTIDAEESDRLDLTLDMMESLCLHPDLQGWNGIGLAVQAYQKRAPFVLEFLIDLARRSGRRLMVRLVKGAYWDGEIKRCQQDGLADFPVFTRKIHTDISYLACARLMLAAPDAIFPQFATHNARTLATIQTWAGDQDYEFQCLHGMGEPLYDQVKHPCRIYAPVGSHRTLLAYLVRRLLENGANSSFVHRLADPAVSIDELIADPVAQARLVVPLGAPHPAIALPRNLFGAKRRNSAGLDLSDEGQLARLDASADQTLPDLMPSLAVESALSQADAAFCGWSATSPQFRADCLERAADLFQSDLPNWLDLLAVEAGKTKPNAIGEVREAIDFLRYYASQIRHPGLELRPLGPVVCISPWNFPLAIFIGQVAAALAVGNTVLAKPADQTPRIALHAGRVLIQAGIPPDVLHILPGDGALGARLVADDRVSGVMFTGSTKVAKLIQHSLSRRLDSVGRPIPLIAETGGLNAMVVDSSARPEQVVADVLVSAFDSAGQRCSALRLLCLQDDIADAVIQGLKGAMAELRLGDPRDFTTDVGPVITPQAQNQIAHYIDQARQRGWRVFQTQSAVTGTFVPPTLIEINRIDELMIEVFGPVLHVVRFTHGQLDRVIEAVNASGYGLTFGLQTRLDDVIDHVQNTVQAGNLYVNRTMIGAVVGVQPFGGSGLSGTGPKAGGPLYLHGVQHADNQPFPGFSKMQSLPGAVGEANLYGVRPRGTILCIAPDHQRLAPLLQAAQATGNRTLISVPPVGLDWTSLPFESVLFDGDQIHLQKLLQDLAANRDSIIPVQVAGHIAWQKLVTERSVSINSAATGGNAELMKLG